MANSLRPYSVFVSSAADDRLQPLVHACLQATWDAGHVVRASFTKQARLKSDQEIRDAEILVRLCSTIDDSLKSDCFRARDQQKPVILLVVSRNTDLAEYTALIQDAPCCCAVQTSATDTEIVARDYLVALTQTVRCMDAERRTASWENEIPSGEVRNPFLRRFVDRIGQWAMLESRFKKNAALKRAAAEFFLDLYFDTLSRARLSRLFFESGSAIAFLSEAFAARASQAARQGSITIETNNILSYMEFVLSQSFPVNLYPAGLPERRYGAVFGPELMALTAPSSGARLVSGKAREIADDIRFHFAEQYTDLGLIFGATSGIDLHHSPEPLGPHVGSYHNMLFKRALLESGAPLIIFADEDKVPLAFENSRCHYVCDEEFPWTFACKNSPLALVCAFRSKERADRVKPALVRLGLENYEGSRDHDVPWCMVASNHLFKQKKEDWRQDAALEELTTSARRPQASASH